MNEALSRVLQVHQISCPLPRLFSLLPQSFHLFLDPFALLLAFSIFYCISRCLFSYLNISVFTIIIKASNLVLHVLLRSASKSIILLQAKMSFYHSEPRCQIVLFSLFIWLLNVWAVRMPWARTSHSSSAGYPHDSRDSHHQHRRWNHHCLLTTQDPVSKQRSLSSPR